MRLPIHLLLACATAFATHAGAMPMPIADKADALTFARAEAGGGYRLILVDSWDEAEVTGIDLTAMHGESDPITLFAKLGYETLASIDAARVTLPADTLTVPADLAASHIAVGTNFPAHAEEATVEDGPFLFPKETRPTAFTAPIPAGDGLLDYEVELCFVTLADFPVDAPPERAGLILCNDVTDRARLMRHLDPDDVTSGKGFTTGKSGPGFMPVGPLFVIPRDLRTFAAAIRLELYRGDDLAQQAVQSIAIWDFDEILRQADMRRDIVWDYNGRPVALPIEDGMVRARTGILAGTPDGTIFKGIDRMAMVRGALDWLLGGWNTPLADWVIERHIARAKAQGAYLQPGEVVRMRADYLGATRNPVAE